MATPVDGQTGAVTSTRSDDLPVIDVSALVAGHDDAATAAALDLACRTWGFFLISGHDAPDQLRADLDAAARRSFALPEAQKAEIAMARGGRAWRGWFPAGAELTDGVPDGKEGLYFGEDLPADHPRVLAGTPMHGANLYAEAVPELRLAVDAWMAEMTRVGHALVRAVGTGLGLGPDWFHQHLTAEPTVLFRVFRYPPAPDAAAWGVAEHTDYGLLTLLAHDGASGLQVRGPDGWIDVPAVDGTIVVNLGDWLEALSGGRYRSTPHRVRSPDAGAADRLSYPFFFDPGWDAVVPGQCGTYGDHLLGKVAQVFPALGEAVFEQG
jgi:isopenicillin N synthase-like dioxygenase